MTIAAVAQQSNMTTDTLRYYEKIGLIPKVTRTSGGIRNYTDTDIGWVEFIKCMRSSGLSVEALVEYVRLCQQGEHTIDDRKVLLKRERDALAERVAQMQQNLDKLNYKINHYDEIFAKKM